MGINLIRGISVVPVNVTVTLRSGSATGIYKHYVCNCFLTTVIANVDFDPTPLTASIPAGQTTTSVTVPIFQDNTRESNETFILMLELLVPIPGVTVAGVNTASGIIIDSTGME